RPIPYYSNKRRAKAPFRLRNLHCCAIPWTQPYLLVIRRDKKSNMTHQPKFQEKPRIGITIGDLNGVGPEVVMKALADSRILNMVTPVIYGSSRVLSYYKKLFTLEEFNFTQIKNKGQFTARSINVVNCWE